MIPALILILLVVIYTFRTGISPAPTMGKVKRELFKMLPEKIEGTVYELGSGWGTLAIPLARRYSRVVAYELSPLPYLVSWLRATPIRNLILRRRNFWKEPLPDAGLIVCYLFPKAMTRLKEHIPPGTLVLSHTFAIPGWTPVATSTANDLYKTKIYLYQA